MDYKGALNILIAVLLLFGGLYLATKLGYIHCTDVPNWCGLYKSINERLYGRPYPLVLVVYGESGMGDPQIVKEYFERVCKIRTQLRRIGEVSLGNLSGYDVAIVTHARYLTARELEILWDFVAGGGKLIIIGDVGVEGPEDEYLRWEDLDINREGIVNRWDRKKEDGTVIEFGSVLLGLKYLGEGSFGELITERGELTDGMEKRIEINVSFVAVESMGSSLFGPHIVEGVIDNTKAVGDGEPPYPAIIRSGYRLFYISFAPEDTGNMLIYNNLCRVVT